MIDLHHDLLSILYYCDIHKRDDYLKKWLSNFNEDNVSGLIANLYFMSQDEMKVEIGNREIDVLDMFREATSLFKKYLPDEKVIFSIEGCDYIKGEDELEELYKLGLRNILLVWNNPNKYGSGNRGEYGLTEEGKKFLIKAIDLGISLDLSHMNKRTFYDSIQLIKEEKKKGKNVKVIASHSNCYSICQHERNLDDDQIRALKEVDGILGLVAYSVFVLENGNKEKYQEVYLEHIDHAISIMGVDQVSVSSDDMDFALTLFNEDFGDMVFDYSHISKDLENLLKKHYNEDEVQKIMYQNIYNKLFREVY